MSSSLFRSSRGSTSQYRISSHQVPPSGSFTGCRPYPGQMKPWRLAAAAGLVGSTAITGAMALVHTLAPSVPFLPLALAQAVVRAAPGGLATYFIERLGHWAIRLAVVGTLVSFLASGAVLGVIIAAMDERSRG